MTGDETNTTSVQVTTQSEDVTETQREKCTNCCKGFIAFVFSTIGLSCVLVAYAIIGGFVFVYLEAEQEKKLKMDVQMARHWHVKHLWHLTLQLNVFHEGNWTAMAEKLFKNYTATIYEATKRQGWDGKDGETEVQWTFAGALLYSITIITTIGYGHISPKTRMGRLVTILYAIFGIPLTLLTLANLGGFMATGCRFLYKNICCGVCCVCCPRRFFDKASSVKFKGDEAKNSELNDALTGKENAHNQIVEGDDVASSPPPTPSPKYSIRVYWQRGISRMVKTEDNKNVRVPIYVCLILIASYILGGAVLFTLWEDDWDYLIGTYFCFITLTTVGFGDYVPGTSLDSRSGQEKLVFCAFYVLFGLALIAMCFDLIQEEARNKFRTLGKKLGLLDKE